MNRRERFLLIILLGLLIVVGGWALFYFFYQKPMDSLNSRLEVVKKEVTERELEKERSTSEMKQIVQRNPHLHLWAKISLPEAKLPPGKLKTPKDGDDHVRQVQGDYQQYLFNLLRNNGFIPSSLSVTPSQPDSKNSPVNPGKGPFYTRLTFKIKGQAKLSAVVATLKHFYEDSLLHEVHMLSITKLGTARQGAGPDDLEVDMEVQALLVKDAEARTELKPTFADKTQSPPAHADGRQYDDILKKNFFTGRNIVEQALSEDPKQVLGAVILTTVYWNGRRWEANFYDQAKGPFLDSDNKERWEKQVNADTVQELNVLDRYQKVVLTAKIVKVEDRLVVFQSKGKYYKLTTGDYLYPAIEHPLSDREIKDLGLTPLANAEPEKSPVAKKEPEKSPAEKDEPAPD